MERSIKGRLLVAIRPRQTARQTLAGVALYQLYYRIDHPVWDCAALAFAAWHPSPQKAFDLCATTTTVVDYLSPTGSPRSGRAQQNGPRA
jgi:hypothetical protein